MKTLLLSLIFATGIATLSAQEATVKATTMLLPDGSRTDSSINYAENTLEEKTYNTSGTLTRHVVYQLDATRQPSGGVLYSPQGTVLYHFTFKRDPAGRIVEETNLNAQGVVLRRMTYEYNSRGEISQLNTFDASGRQISTQEAIRRPEKIAIQTATAGQLQPVDPAEQNRPRPTASRPARPVPQAAAQVRRAEPVRRAQPVDASAYAAYEEAARAARASRGTGEAAATPTPTATTTRPKGPRVQHGAWEVVPQ